MDELHGCRQIDVMIAAIAAETRCRESEERPQSLAARIDKVAGEIGDKRDRAADSVVNQLVRCRHIVRKKTMQPVYGRMADFSGFRCLSDRHAYARDTALPSRFGSATLGMGQNAGQGEALRGFLTSSKG